MKKNIVIICVLAIIVLSAVLGVSISINSDVNGINIKDDITIEIQQGEYGNSVISKLAESNAVKYPSIFKSKAKSDNKITKFKPGSITLKNGMSYDDIIDLLISDNRGLIKVTIPEGYEMRQIAERFAETGIITTDEFYSAANNDDFDYKFLADIPNIENRLEGYLFPETYLISENATAHAIIDMMLAEFDKHFKDEYYSRAEELDMTVHELVTLASIIERETNIAEERAIVSGVFHNRVRDNMKLQSCATVEYILKERKAKLSNKDLAIDSKYNTYKYAGLPIGPIASAGSECIEAAFYPAETTAKYFVLGKDGKHVFSDTYEQHLNAKNQAEK